MAVRLAERDIDIVMEDPFFIFYASRSGSTFLANELTKRFRVLITPETTFMTDTLGQYGHVAFESDRQVDTLVATILTDPKFADLEIGGATLAAMLKARIPFTQSDAVRIILNHYRRQRALDGCKCGIKQGGYLHHYRELLRMFPSAKFIGLIRDGRAVFNSQKHSINSDNQPMAKSPKKAARRWVTMTKLMRELELDHPGVIIVKYETLIEDTEQTLAEIGAFLDVEPTHHSEQIRRYEVPARYGRDLHRNINKSPLTDRISAWRSSLPKNEIAEFEAVAGECLVEEGYELVNEGASTSLWSRLMS